MNDSHVCILILVLELKCVSKISSDNMRYNFRKGTFSNFYQLLPFLDRKSMKFCIQEELYTNFIGFLYKMAEW